MLTYTQAFLLLTQWKFLSWKDFSALLLEVHYSHSFCAHTDQLQVEIFTLQKVSVDAGFCKQIPVYANKFQYKLLRCQCLCTTTNCSVDEHILTEMPQISSALYPGSTCSFWHISKKGFAPSITNTTSLLTAMSPFSRPGQKQRAHGVPLLLTAAAPLNSQAPCPFVRIAGDAGLSRHSPTFHR